MAIVLNFMTVSVHSVLNGGATDGSMSPQSAMANAMDDVTESELLLDHLERSQPVRLDHSIVSNTHIYVRGRLSCHQYPNSSTTLQMCVGD